ncbi:hypothetical protein K502DRAFT_323176 [Neoconidiobolus thromboides FSU 785]|nr:hypothetical protein K502DRAFT_323176 [Neoconidiobolus thromboides FSU 785]
MIAKVTNPGEDFNLNELNLGDNFTNLNDDTQSESPQLNGKKPASLSNKSNKTKFAEKDENTTNNLLTNDINSTKRNLKLQELIEKQKNDKESGNIRRTRSGRAVIKPLEYWKNEEKELPKAISLKFSWGGNKVCILNEANNTMEARNTRKRRSRSKKDQGFLEDSTTTQKPVLRETRVHNNKGMKRKKEGKINLSFNSINIQQSLEPDVISPKDKKVATKKPKAAKKTNKIDLSVNKKELYNQTSNVKNAKQNGILKETQKIIKEQGAPSGNKGITYIERYKKALEAEDNETVIPRGKKVYQNANTMLNKALKGEVNYLFEGKVVDSEVDNSIDQKALSEFDIYEMSE